MVVDPWWPVVLLAAIQVVDGVLCLGPVSFVAACLDDVRFPRRFWWVLSPIKFAAAAGLLLGLWVPHLALVTACCLVAYFVAAIGGHLRARDLGRNLAVNALGMLVLCVAVAGTLAA